MKDKIFAGALFVIGMIDLWQIHQDGSRWISKPLIMLILISYYLVNYKSLDSNKPRLLFLLALIAALAGDSFLLFDGCFVYGLASFLLMQILYSYCFWKDRSTQGKKGFYGIVLILFIGIVTSLLWDKLEEMKVPVMVYMAAISIMSFMAFVRNSTSPGFWWIFIGTVLFMISDTVLAVHQFTDNIHLGTLTVMSTYITAQFFIVRGYIIDHRING